jgi:hypothetical protein
MGVLYHLHDSLRLQVGVAVVYIPIGIQRELQASVGGTCLEQCTDAPGRRKAAAVSREVLVADDV